MEKITNLYSRFRYPALNLISFTQSKIRYPKFPHILQHLPIIFILMRKTPQNYPNINKFTYCENKLG